MLDVQETDFKLSKKLPDTPYHLQDSKPAASALQLGGSRGNIVRKKVRNCIRVEKN